MLELYKNIKKYRSEKKMTQDELAKLTGYTDRSSIAKIERGDVDLPQSKIMLFANALGIDAGTLMGNTGISTSPAPTLTADENTLLTDYRKLNEAGKNQALRQVADLTEIDKYTVKGGGSAGLRSDAG